MTVRTLAAISISIGLFGAVAGCVRNQAKIGKRTLPRHDPGQPGQRPGREAEAGTEGPHPEVATITPPTPDEKPVVPAEYLSAPVAVAEPPANAAAQPPRPVRERIQDRREERQEQRKPDQKPDPKAEPKRNPSRHCPRRSRKTKKTKAA